MALTGPMLGNHRPTYGLWSVLLSQQVQALLTFSLPKIVTPITANFDPAVETCEQRQGECYIPAYILTRFYVVEVVQQRAAATMLRQSENLPGRHATPAWRNKEHWEEQVIGAVVAVCVHTPRWAVG